MNISEYIIAVLALELTPGPNIAYLATLALTRGRVAGLAAVLGVACGLGLHVLVAALGVAALVEKFPVVYEALRWIGVGYLLYLAWYAWRPASETSLDPLEDSPGVGPFFWQGLLSNVLNPKSVMFFISVVPNFVVTQNGWSSIPMQMALLGSIYVAIATAIHTSIVMLASHMRNFTMRERRRDAMRKVLAVALVFVAIWLAWSTGP